MVTQREALEAIVDKMIRDDTVTVFDNGYMLAVSQWDLDEDPTAENNTIAVIYDKDCGFQDIASNSLGSDDAYAAGYTSDLVFDQKVGTVDSLAVYKNGKLNPDLLDRLENLKVFKNPDSPVYLMANSVDGIHARAQAFVHGKPELEVKLEDIDLDAVRSAVGYLEENAYTYNNNLHDEIAALNNVLEYCKEHAGETVSEERTAEANRELGDLLAESGTIAFTSNGYVVATSDEYYPGEEEGERNERRTAVYKVDPAEFIKNPGDILENPEFDRAGDLVWPESGDKMLATFRTLDEAGNRTQEFNAFASGKGLDLGEVLALSDTVSGLKDNLIDKMVGALSHDVGSKEMTMAKTQAEKEPVKIVNEYDLDIAYLSDLEGNFGSANPPTAALEAREQAPVSCLGDTRIVELDGEIRPMVEFKVDGYGRYAEIKAGDMARQIASSLPESVADETTISIAASGEESFASVTLPAGLTHDVMQEAVDSVDGALVEAGLDKDIEVHDYEWNREGKAAESPNESLDDIMADIPTEGIGEAMESAEEHLMNH